MKSILATLALIALATPAFASQVKDITKAASPVLEGVFSAGFEFAFEKEKGYTDSHIGGGTIANAYKITKVTKGGASETPAQTYERVAKSLIHHDFPITGDDGGYQFTLMSGSDSAPAQVASPFNTDESDEQITTLNKNLAAALTDAANHGLIVLIGSGSGNNTMADIAVVADPANSEIIYIIDSNFGSDD